MEVQPQQQSDEAASNNTQEDGGHAFARGEHRMRLPSQHQKKKTNEVQNKHSKSNNTDETYVMEAKPQQQSDEAANNNNQEDSGRAFVRGEHGMGLLSKEEILHHLRQDKHQDKRSGIYLLAFSPLPPLFQSWSSSFVFDLFI